MICESWNKGGCLCTECDHIDNISCSIHKCECCNRRVWYGVDNIKGDIKPNA